MVNKPRPNPILFLNVASLEEEVVQLQQSSKAKDSEIAELRASAAAKAEIHSRQLSNALQELADVQIELMNLKSQMLPTLGRPTTPMSTPQLRSMSRTSLASNASRCVTPVSDSPEPGTVSVRVIAVSRALPPIHSTYMSASNFSNPRSVPSTRAEAMMNGPPKTPKEAVMVSWPASVQEVSRYNRLTHSRGSDRPKTPAMQSNLPVSAQPGTLSVGTTSDTEVQSVGVQISPLPWTRFYFSDMQIGLVSGNGKNPLYHHFDVQTDSNGEVVPWESPKDDPFKPTPPEWAPQAFHKLYYAFMDEDQRLKQKHYRKKCAEGAGESGISEEPEKSVNLPWDLLSEDILDHARDYHVLKDFIDQVVKLRPRCEADSRPLLLLFAGLVSYLSSQISNIVDHQRLQHEQTQSQLAEEMKNIKEQMSALLDASTQENKNLYQEKVNKVVAKMGTQLMLAVNKHKMNQNMSAMDIALEEISALKALLNDQATRSKELEGAVEEMRLKNEALQTQLSEMAQENAQLQETIVEAELQEQARQEADRLVLMKNEEETRRAKKLLEATIKEEQELEVELTRVAHSMAKGKHQGKQEIDLLADKLRVARRQRDQYIHLYEDTKRRMMVSRMRHNALSNKLVQQVGQMTMERDNLLAAQTLLLEEITAKATENSAIQELAQRAKHDLVNATHKHMIVVEKMATELHASAEDLRLAEAEKEMARRSQVEMLYMNEEKKEAQSLLGSLDGRLQQMRDQAVEQVECMQAALETAISLHRAELEIQLQGVQDAEEILMLKSKSTEHEKKLRHDMEARAQEVHALSKAKANLEHWAVSKNKIVVLQQTIEKLQDAASDAGEHHRKELEAELSDAVLEIKKLAADPSLDSLGGSAKLPQAAGDLDLSTEDLQARSALAKQQMQEVETGYYDLLKQEHPKMPPIAPCNLDESLAPLTIETSLDAGAGEDGMEVKEELEKAQRQADLRMMVLHTSDQDMFSRIFREGGSWSKVTSYEGMMELAISAMDQFRVLFKVDMCLTELSFENQAEDDDEMMEAPDDYSNCVLNVQYTTGPLPNKVCQLIENPSSRTAKILKQIFCIEMVEIHDVLHSNSASSYFHSIQSAASLSVWHLYPCKVKATEDMRELVIPISFPTLKTQSNSRRIFGTLSMFVSQERLEMFAKLRHCEIAELRAQMEGTQAVIASGIGKMAEFLERVHFSELASLHSSRMQLKRYEEHKEHVTGEEVDVRLSLEIELEELLKGKRRLELMLSKRIVKNSLGALKRFSVLGQAPVGALCGVYLILKYQGAADFLPVGEDGFLRLPSHPNKLKELWFAKNRMLRVSKLVLDMRNYDSMILIPEGDTDVDDDGLGDEIMTRMANVEAILEDVDFNESKKTAAGILHEWAITVVRILQTNARLIGHIKGDTKLIQKARLRDRAIDTAEVAAERRDSGPRQPPPMAAGEFMRTAVAYPPE